MPSTIPPSKQLIRDYLDSRTCSDDPPPTPAEIRRQLPGTCCPANSSQIVPSATEQGSNEFQMLPYWQACL